MPRQERAERTRQRLIQAAAASFDQAGFAMTGLNDVIRPTGISKGALYFHFGSKEQLAEAVMADSRAGLREAIRSARHSSDCPLQYLIDLSHGLARRLAEDVVFRAGLRLTSDGALGEDLRPNPHPGWTLMIGRLLDRAQTRRDLRGEVRTAETAALLAAVGAGVESLARRNRDWLSPPVIALLWAAVLPALVSPEQLVRLRTAAADADPRAVLPAQDHSGPAADEHGRAGAPSTPEGRPRAEAGPSDAGSAAALDHTAESANSPEEQISSRYQAL